MGLPDIEPFQAEFEDVEICIHKMSAVEFIDDNEGKHKYSGTIGIWENAIANHPFRNGRDLIGGIQVSFRNQGIHFDSVIFVTCTFSAASESDPNGASVFAKFMQFLFAWFEDYIKDNSIMDMVEGEEFKLPAYCLSKADFPKFENQ